jgi:uncharacterized spore protein YtfJ
MRIAHPKRQMGGVMDATALANIVNDVTKAIQAEGNSRAIFGEPLQLETHKVIPVAAIEIGMGGGGAGAGPRTSHDEGLRRTISQLARRLIPFGFGGGMGGGVKVRPIGFIHEENGQVVYSAIP